MTMARFREQDLVTVARKSLRITDHSWRLLSCTFGSREIKDNKM